MVVLAPKPWGVRRTITGSGLIVRLMLDQGRNSPSPTTKDRGPAGRFSVNPLAQYLDVLRVTEHSIAFLRGQFSNYPK